MSNILETITLYFCQGRSDKFYTVSIEEDGSGCSVQANWGRRGSSGQFGCKASGVSYEDATKVYNKLINSKAAKGYEEGESMATVSPVPDLPNPHAERSKATTATATVRKIDWDDGEDISAPVSALNTKVKSGLLPQLLNEIQEEEVQKYINDDRYFAQEKHDGKRRMLRNESGKTEGINKKGFVVGYPKDFEGACRSITAVNSLRNFTLDGEEVGDTLHTFDLLDLNGKDLRSLSYESRLLKLVDYFSDISDSIRVVETAHTRKEKTALYKRLKKEGKEGIIFKLRDGTHKVGYSPDQVKFKFYATASVIVTKHNTKNSVAVAVMDGNEQIPVGNVTMIGHERPPVGTVIEVRYLYAYRGGSLYQPNYLDVRDDTDASDCTIAKLKFKSEG